MIQTVRVTTRVDPDPRGQSLLVEVKRLGITAITGIKTARVYRLEGVTEAEAKLLSQRLLEDPIIQSATLNAPILSGATVIEVANKPGVMNPESASIMKAASDLGITNLVAVDASTEYLFVGQPNPADLRLILQRELVNKTVGRVITPDEPFRALVQQWLSPNPDDPDETVATVPPTTLLITGQPGPITTVPIRLLSDDELMELSRDKLFLNLEEMSIIQAHFRELGRDPTDAEVETLAQTWSEHCGHKTFKARVIVNGVEKTPFIERLKAATARHNQLVLSAFHDNSGVIKFYDGFAVCGKVETHNAPSAIEPYGGAATGSGGVFRDIAGTGHGAKVILSTDIFCFAPPGLPLERIPEGCLHPDYLLRRVVAGVRDYGNRMGIPTANGSVHFHADFRAKPSVIVGAYGLIPADRCQRREPQPGDRIVVLGGRTGRDGIHGATFSSAEMTDRTMHVNAAAVQIGNAIEEKRVFDAILACRDAGVISALTDCGAGGFSSAIGEMGANTGARVYLERAPLKYPGLAPWETWVSEAQERMVLAVAPEHVEQALAICRDFNVETTVLGEFTNDGRLTVTYNGASVCDLTMQFLHHGLPQRVMTARWVKPAFEEPDIPEPTDWAETYHRVMAHLNVCSKEPIVRMYDHGVQGKTVLYPCAGVHHDGPNDAVVLQPIPDKPYGFVISHGCNPVLNLVDPYWGGIWAGVEAVANLVAVGGNPRECALIDNCIWPPPDEESLGALDQAVDACVALADAFGAPFVSGKDSLGGKFVGKDGTIIKIPPVLCVSCFGRIPDVAKTVTADFKQPGSYVVLLGRLDPSAMGGSVYSDLHGALGSRLPHVDLELTPRIFDRVHQLIQQGAIRSAHDISEGGVGVALAEMCFGGDRGATVHLSLLGEGQRPDFLFFNEMAGSFLLEFNPEQPITELLSPLPYRVFGFTTPQRVITLMYDNKLRDTMPIADLKSAWQQPMKEVFH